MMMNKVAARRIATGRGDCFTLRAYRLPGGAPVTSVALFRRWPRRVSISRIPRALSDSRGFTFVELIVALAIMIMMAAVVTPVLLGSLDNARVEASQKSLLAIIDAITQFEADVNRYNATISQLVGQISSSDYDICGSTFPPGLADKWAGPYISQNVTAGGIPTPIGVIRNELTPATLAGGQPVMLVQVDGVRATDAVSLNREVDGADGDDDPTQAGDSGSLMWSVPVAGQVTMFYALPMKKC